MRAFAKVVDGLVTRKYVFQDDTDLDDLAKRNPEQAAQLVEVTTGQQVARGWSWDGEVFAPPKPPPAPSWYEGRKLTPSQEAHVLDSHADMIDSIEAAGGNVTPKMNAVRNKIRQLQADHPEAQE